MKKFLKTNLDAVLVFAATAFLALIVLSFSWAIGNIVMYRMVNFKF